MAAKTSITKASSFLNRPIKALRDHEQLGLVAAILLIGLAVSLLTYSGSHVVAKPTGVHTPVAISSVRPTTSQISDYHVAADLPKYISIPAIKLGQTRIIALGLASGNQIAVPTNVYDAGWYNASAKPGQPGAMFIFAHVANWTAKGAFFSLSKLKSGDIVAVVRGDNTIYSYQVAAVKTYPAAAVDMGAVLAPIDRSHPGLNLMTCTGTVDQKTGAYADRLVVFTRLVSS